MDETVPERLRAELYLGIQSGTFVVLAVYGDPPEGPGGRLAGIVACQVCDTLPLGPHLFVRFLYVYPSWRKTRAAWSLLSALTAEMMRRGFGDFLVVGGAVGTFRRSYRKLGFLPLAEYGVSKVARVAKKLGVR